MLIDFHVRAFPNYAEGRLPGEALDQLQLLRRKSRDLLRPFSSAIHDFQPLARHIPKRLRKVIDEIGGLAGIPRLVIESTVEDFLEEMERSGVSHAVIVAHPPFISNNFVLETARLRKQLIPSVVVSSEDDPAQVEILAGKGAKLIKINPVVEGKNPSLDRYAPILEAAQEINIPVMLHTGSNSIPLLYRNPMMGDARLFKEWFKKFPKVRFILNHTNFHKPMVAINLAEEFKNIYLELSWQPYEILGECFRLLGSSRLLFGSDWPFFGDNVSIAKEKVNRCVELGTFTDKDRDRIFFKNGSELLGLGNAKKISRPQHDGSRRT